MLVKGLLRFFSRINLCSNRKSFSVMNSSGYQSRFYFRNIHASANVWEPEKNHRLNDLEVGTFRNYLEKNNNFKSPVSEIINLNFSLDKHESLKLLVKLKENMGNDCLWQEMLDCLNREVSTFDTEDFLKIIALASDVKIKEDKQKFLDFVSCLDKELKVRTFGLNDVLEILYVLKHTLFMGKSLKLLRFYLKSYRALQKLHKFDPLQVTHLFYYLEDISDLTRTFYKYPVLKYVEENISQLNIDEMGIVLAALSRAKVFKTNVEFIQRITDKLLNEIETVKSIHLFYICRFLFNCSSVYNRNIILDFQGKLIPYISRFKPKSLISALFSGYPFTLNKSFWNNVVEKLEVELKTLSMSDIERMTRITAAYKIENNEEFLKLAIEAIEERKNIEYSTHLVKCCKHFVIHRVYPKKLLDILLSKDFVKNMITRSFSKEMTAWSFLNYSLQIDKPECQCVCLDEVLEKNIMKGVYAGRTKENLVISPFKTRVRLGRYLKAIFGNSAVVEKHCLPHLEKALVMRFDENLNVTAVPQDFQFGFKKIVPVPLDEHFWICVNATFIPSEGLCPFQETYMRHLSACGYTPILVECFEFCHYEKLGTEELRKYFEDLIQKALEETLRKKQTQKLNSNKIENESI